MKINPVLVSALLGATYATLTHTSWMGKLSAPPPSPAVQALPAPAALLEQARRDLAEADAKAKAKAQAQAERLERIRTQVEAKIHDLYSTAEGELNSDGETIRVLEAEGQALTAEYSTVNPADTAASADLAARVAKHNKALVPLQRKYHGGWTHEVACKCLAVREKAERLGLEQPFIDAQEYKHREESLKEAVMAWGDETRTGVAGAYDESWVIKQQKALLDRNPPLSSY